MTDDSSWLVVMALPLEAQDMLEKAAFPFCTQASAR